MVRRVASSRAGWVSILAALGILFALLPARAGEGTLTGNVGVTSKYVFRGVVESDRATVQGGLDYAHPSGWYAGYWGSQLDYTQGMNSDGFENDLYLGYACDRGKWSLDVGALHYLYANVDEDPVTGEDADATDLYGTVGYGPVSLGVAWAVSNASWINRGDVYTTLSYGTELPKGFSLRAKAGYFFYDNDPSNLSGTESSNFNDATVSLSHPIGDSPASMSLGYVLAGDGRNDMPVGDNQVILGVRWGFDVTE